MPYHGKKNVTMSDFMQESIDAFASQHTDVAPLHPADIVSGIHSSISDHGEHVITLLKEYISEITLEHVEKAWVDWQTEKRSAIKALRCAWERDDSVTYKACSEERREATLIERFDPGGQQSERWKERLESARALEFIRFYCDCHKIMLSMQHSYTFICKNWDSIAQAAGGDGMETSSFWTGTRRLDAILISVAKFMGKGIENERFNRGKRLADFRRIFLQRHAPKAATWDRDNDEDSSGEEEVQKVKKVSGEKVETPTTPKQISMAEKYREWDAYDETVRAIHFTSSIGTRGEYAHFENAEALRMLLELPSDHPCSLESCIQQTQCHSDIKKKDNEVNSLHADLLMLRKSPILKPVLNSMSLVFGHLMRPVQTYVQTGDRSKLDSIPVWKQLKACAKTLSTFDDEWSELPFLLTPTGCFDTPCYHAPWQFLTIASDKRVLKTRTAHLGGACDQSTRKPVLDARGRRMRVLKITSKMTRDELVTANAALRVLTEGLLHAHYCNQEKHQEWGGSLLSSAAGSRLRQVARYVPATSAAIESFFGLLSYLEGMERRYRARNRQHIIMLREVKLWEKLRKLRHNDEKTFHLIWNRVRSLRALHEQRLDYCSWHLKKRSRERTEKNIHKKDKAAFANGVQRLGWEQLARNWVHLDTAALQVKLTLMCAGCEGGYAGTEATEKRLKYLVDNLRMFQKIHLLYQVKDVDVYSCFRTQAFIAEGKGKGLAPTFRWQKTIDPETKEVIGKHKHVYTEEELKKNLVTCSMYAHTHVTAWRGTEYKVNDRVVLTMPRDDVPAIGDVVHVLYSTPQRRKSKARKGPPADTVPEWWVGEVRLVHAATNEFTAFFKRDNTVVKMNWRDTAALKWPNHNVPRHCTVARSLGDGKFDLCADKRPGENGPRMLMDIEASFLVLIETDGEVTRQDARDAMERKPVSDRAKFGRHGHKRGSI
jgi:hypothetical protein